MWVYYASLIAVFWILLIWILVFPALLKHLMTARGLGDILLYSSQFLFAPVTSIVVLLLFLVGLLAKIILELIKATIAVALMILLIISAPLVWLVERFNMKPGWLIEQWLKVGDLVLDLLHKLFNKAWGTFASLLVSNPKPVSPPQAMSAQPK